MLSTRRVLGTLLLALLLHACSTATDVPVLPADAGTVVDPDCPIGFLGDPAKDPEIEIIALGADGKSSKVEDGSEVAMILPPDGGRIIYAGVRMTNLDPCNFKLSGTLRDPQSGALRVDTRTLWRVVEEGNGWGRSDDEDLSSFASVPVCPNQWSVTDLYSATYELTMTVTDRGGRTATKTAKVKPACAEPDFEAHCLCICKAGHVLGETCSGAGGAGGAP